jgi:hypothetical protein
MKGQKMKDSGKAKVVISIGDASCVASGNVQLHFPSGTGGEAIVEVELDHSLEEESEQFKDVNMVAVMMRHCAIYWEK